MSFSDQRYGNVTPDVYEDTIRFLHGGGLDCYVAGIHALLDLGHFHPAASVREFCCGTGLSTREIVKREHSELYACDAHADFIRYAQQHVQAPAVGYPQKEPLRFHQYDLREWLGIWEKVLRKEDIIVMCNASELFRETCVFDVARKLLRPAGEFLYNIKIRDGKKSVYSGLYEKFVAVHNSHFSREGRIPDGTVMGAVVEGTMTEEDVLRSPHFGGFRVKTSVKRVSRFDAPGMGSFSFDLRERLFQFLMRQYGIGSEHETQGQWLRREVDAEFEAASDQWRRTEDPYHMKTELLVCAERKE